MTSKSTVYLAIPIMYIRDGEGLEYTTMSAVDPCFPPRFVWSYTWSRYSSGIPLTICLATIYDGLKNICAEHDVVLRGSDGTAWTTLERLLHGQYGGDLYHDLGSIFASFVGND